MAAYTPAHRRAPKRRVKRGRAAAILTAAIFIGSLCTIGVSPVANAATTGGVNTGQPGSTCAATDGGLTFTPPGAGVSTSSLGSAPAYYELGAPDGAFLNRPPKGLMIVIHGGGWSTVGPGAVAAVRPVAEIWRNRGWDTLNIDYRACQQSIGDVVWFHDAARALVGRSLPLCTIGESAGAHLALIMASHRSDVGCVVAEGGPTDLPLLNTETAYDPTTQVSDQYSGPTWVQNLAIAAFGAGQLTAVSPTTSPGIARLLIATAQQDEFVPWAQAQDLASAVNNVHPGTYVDLDQLAPGTYYPFTHTDLSAGTGVSQSAYDDYLVRQLKLVAPMVAPKNVTKSVINDIRVPSLGNYSVGDEEFDTTALSGRTSGAMNGRIALGPGNTFQLTSCISYYDPVRAPVGTCSSATIDTQSNTSTAGYNIPSVSTQWQDPAAGTGKGFACAVVSVSYLNNGVWTPVASSEPDSSTDAGVWIP